MVVKLLKISKESFQTKHIMIYIERANTTALFTINYQCWIVKPIKHKDFQHSDNRDLLLISKIQRQSAS